MVDGDADGDVADDGGGVPAELLKAGAGDEAGGAVEAEEAEEAGGGTAQVEPP